jgi:hypothetical protein
MHIPKRESPGVSATTRSNRVAARSWVAALVIETS